MGTVVAVPKIHPGATLTPHWNEFLPPWVSRQPWYRGSGIPSLRPVGYFRFEDRAGQVGMETHLVADGSVLYQIPMTYRDAPLARIADGTDSAEHALIATAEHSVLGTRWIYDAEADPVWVSELLRLVWNEAISEPSTRRGTGPAEARGQLLAPEHLRDQPVRIELERMPASGSRATAPGVTGLLMGSWYPDGPDTAPVTGCLALVRRL